MSGNVTERVADWVQDLSFDQLPDEIVMESKYCWLDVVGLIIGGSRESGVGAVARAMRIASGGECQATMLYDGGKSPLAAAAMVNGTASHILDYDDTHLSTSIHPTGPVAAASLAVAEWKGLTGRDLIVSLVAGIETECKIGLTMRGHYGAGWHSTATLGGLGSASAVSKLLGLQKGEINAALGIAASGAGGFREAFGSMVKSFHVGRAASNGVIAAMLAAEGMSAPVDPIGGRRGFASVFSEAFDPSVVERLGLDWELLNVGRKPYACGVVIHPSVDGVVALMKRTGLGVDDIREIVLKVHPHVLDLTGVRNPQVGLEGKFSVYYAVAAAAISCSLGQGEFSDAAVARPAVRTLSQRVRVEVDPAVARNQAWVRVVPSKGEAVETFVAAALGSPANRMNEEQLMGKYLSLAEPTLGRRGAEEVAGMIMNLETATDTRVLMDMLTDIQPT